MPSTNLGMLRRTSRSAASDECYTPPAAVLPLLKYLDRDNVWYEATSSASPSIVNCLRENGFKVKEAEGDFFECTHVYDGIVTNPPYSIKDKFIERCFYFEKPFALLLPTAALAGQRRGAMWRKHGIQILQFPRRIDFTGKGSPHFDVAWFCHRIFPPQYSDIQFVESQNE